MFDIATVVGDSEHVAVAGDWHGDTGWAMQTIRLAAASGVKVIYQVGDFGLWGGSDGASYLRKVNRTLAKEGIILVVTPGNHENYNMLKGFPVNQYDFHSRSHLEPNIWYAPRGHVWAHNGTVMASLGGAVSSDSDMRTPGKTWWPEEATTPEDVNALRANLTAHGVSRVDIMFTHEAPAGVPLPQRHISLPPTIEAGINRQRVILRDAMDTAWPRMLFHGHHHMIVDELIECVNFHGDEYTVRVVGLDMNGHAGNLALLNLRTGGVVRKPKG